MLVTLIKYANGHNIILKLNEKYNFGDYPFLLTCTKNNLEIEKLLINYANEKNIKLNIASQIKILVGIIHFQEFAKIIIMKC